LPPLFEKYGERLQVIGVDTTQPGGQDLYQAAIQRYGIPEERRGVPTLIIGDVVLVGSLEIPRQLPDLIEEHLAQEGVEWPDIPGLVEALAATQPTPDATPAQPTPTVTPAPTLPATAPVSPPSSAPALTPTPTRSVLMVTEDDPPDWRAKLARDPAGNALALLTLLGMALVTSYALVTWPRTADGSTELAEVEPATWQSWAIPFLALLGLGVAGYLAYVETQQVTAVCGPVGDCNTVQQSVYAWLFGLIPIGVLGLVGYAAILVAWGVAHYGNGQLAGLAWMALLVMTLCGTLFSMYLTFLEPFVIGATCAWCLTSAVVMTALLALTATPGKRAISTLFPGRMRRVTLDEGSS
jgi:uncharacterized membrane protein